MRAHTAALVAAALALPVSARELWLAPGEFFVSPGQRLTVLFHLDDASLAPGQLRDAALHTPRGVYNVVNLRSEGPAVAGEASVPSPGTLLLTVRTESETTAGERLRCFAKAILQSAPADAGFNRVAGLPFEIVPEAEPAPGRLPLRLLLDGKPAPGVEVRVARDSAAPVSTGRTDAAGRVEIAVTAPGAYRVLAEVRRRSNDPRGPAWERSSTSLTFSLPPHPN